MSRNYKILAINPGSTSTKIALYQGRQPVFLKTIQHSHNQLSAFDKIADQYHFRKEIILNELRQADIDIHDLNAVVGRGGLLKPIPAGVYEVNEDMIRDLKAGVQGQHASNLGGLIADDIAKMTPHAKAYIADPVVVDEMEDVARITGHPGMTRRSIFHALNQRAVARKYAHGLGHQYEDLNLIVAHLGGGISIGAHRKGKVIDVENALEGFGPFSPERAGALPPGDLVDLCFSGRYSKEEIKDLIHGKGGLMAHFGTNQAYEVEMMAQAGNEKARLVMDAMAYQVAKAIGAAAAVLRGKIDGIILTGGIANNKNTIRYIRDMVSFLGPVIVYPGEDEMQALSENALAVLEGEIKCMQYQ